MFLDFLPIQCIYITSAFNIPSPALVCQKLVFDIIIVLGYNFDIYVQFWHAGNNFIKDQKGAMVGLLPLLHINDICCFYTAVFIKE